MRFRFPYVMYKLQGEECMCVLLFLAVLLPDSSVYTFLVVQMLASVCCGWDPGLPQFSWSYSLQVQLSMAYLLLSFTLMCNLSTFLDARGLVPVYTWN